MGKWYTENTLSPPQPTAKFLLCFVQGLDVLFDFAAPGRSQSLQNGSAQNAPKMPRWIVSFIRLDLYLQWM